MNLLVVIPFHQGDVLTAADTLNWMRQLNGSKDNPCLLVADSKTGLKAVDSVITIAKMAFDRVSITFAKDCSGGWPIAANKMFKHAAAYVAQREHCSFFWCEPDCIPLRTDWIRDLGNAYAKCGKDYMGALVPCDKQGMPSTHLNGNAVYPHDVFVRLGKELDSESAFDIACAELIVPNAANTPLIHHFWGRKDLAPTFVENRKREDPENTMTISNIPRSAALFHRCKDRTLTELLRERMKTNSVAPVIHNVRSHKRSDVMADTA